MSQLSDDDLIELLGGQPNTGVANTFGFGNLPDYGVPNIMTADGPAGLRIAPECGVYNCMAMRNSSCLHLEPESGRKGRSSRSRRSERK